MELFLDHCHFEGNIIDEKPEKFLKYVKEDGTEENKNLILECMLNHIDGVAKN